MEPVTRTEDAQAGTYAVRGAVINFFGQVIPPTLQSGSDASGTAISQRYASVTGFYKFSSSGGDRFGVNVAFYKGETVVAQGAQLLAPTQSYTAFTQTMTYVSADVPDRAIIAFQIIGPVTGSDYHVGSVYQVDEVSFGTGGGGGARPSLTIAKVGAEVVVTWPADAEGYKLQSTATLQPENWTDVQGVAPTDRSHRLTPTTQGYFRLFKP